jgi:hypothetical protein
LLFGIMTSVAVIWAAFFLPESSGVTLELMHRIFEGNIIARSVQDLSPAKRKVFRARLLAEVGGTADDGMVTESARANEPAFATLDREESYAAKKADDDVVKTADAGDSDADHARK